MTEAKYLYVSSTNHGGPGPGAPVHVPLFDGDTTTVRITEGELKATIATELSGILTLGLDGLFGPYLLALKHLKAQSVRLAIDADALRKRNVALALKKTADTLATEGFTVELELWDERDGKGIDDLLAAGKAPEVLKGDEAGAAIARIVAAAKEAQPTKWEQAGLDHPKAISNPWRGQDLWVRG